MLRHCHCCCRRRQNRQQYIDTFQLIGNENGRLIDIFSSLLRSLSLPQRQTCRVEMWANADLSYIDIDDIIRRTVIVNCRCQLIIIAFTLQPFRLQQSFVLMFGFQLQINYAMRKIK